MKTLSIALLIVGLFCVPALAQDAPECDLTPVQPALEAANEDMTLDSLIALKNEIAAVQSACSGLTFTSDEYGFLAAVGPLDVPAGVYRVTVTTDDYLIIAVTTLKGECDDGNLFALTESEATDGAETIFKSEGCSMLFETDMVGTDWTLTFELIQ